ncbi:hypothetical protein HELRODRAFT_184643 [Helobdella robusta]|uniref:Uncharacterized protein n=1 Tax=Helobdella robusta TaxID=6412 RepID=T1FLN4_HELRO|nr:hypothetical protein HELRODRAFT_184643 [Helobdella robusta]ESO07851.1 hypothetical protein HELRODRAFT_184643 [Helobdella robusta]
MFAIISKPPIQHRPPKTSYLCKTVCHNNKNNSNNILVNNSSSNNFSIVNNNNNKISNIFDDNENFFSLTNRGNRCFPTSFEQLNNNMKNCICEKKYTEELKNSQMTASYESSAGKLKKDVENKNFKSNGIQVNDHNNQHSHINYKCKSYSPNNFLKFPTTKTSNVNANKNKISNVSTAENVNRIDDTIQTEASNFSGTSDGNTYHKTSANTLYVVDTDTNSSLPPMIPSYASLKKKKTNNFLFHAFAVFNNKYQNKSKNATNENKHDFNQNDDDHPRNKLPNNASPTVKKTVTIAKTCSSNSLPALNQNIINNDNSNNNGSDNNINNTNTSDCLLGVFSTIMPQHNSLMIRDAVERSSDSSINEKQTSATVAKQNKLSKSKLLFKNIHRRLSLPNNKTEQQIVGQQSSQQQSHQIQQRELQNNGDQVNWQYFSPAKPNQNNKPHYESSSKIKQRQPSPHQQMQHLHHHLNLSARNSIVQNKNKQLSYPSQQQPSHPSQQQLHSSLLFFPQEEDSKRRQQTIQTRDKEEEPPLQKQNIQEPRRMRAKSANSPIGQQSLMRLARSYNVGNNTYSDDNKINEEVVTFNSVVNAIDNKRTFGVEPFQINSHNLTKNNFYSKNGVCCSNSSERSIYNQTNDINNKMKNRNTKISPVIHAKSNALFKNNSLQTNSFPDKVMQDNEFGQHNHANDQIAYLSNEIGNKKNKNCNNVLNYDQVYSGNSINNKKISNYVEQSKENIYEEIDTCFTKQNMVVYQHLAKLC